MRARCVTIVPMTHRADPSAPATMATPIVHACSGAATATGHRRAVNEDAYLDGPDLFVVADGMGGHRAGDVASRLAIDTFAASVGPPPSTVDEIGAAVRRAHEAILADADDDRSGMGTTVVGAAPVVHLGAPAVAVFHVGDSRCYRLIDGELTLVTHDHTHVQELVDAGQLDPREARRHPLRNVVTRALGIELDDGPEITLLAPPFGRLLLCSDGLWAELEARTIGRVLAGVDDPQAAADRLVELTLNGPARDNVTAVVVDLDLATGTPWAPPTQAAVRTEMPPGHPVSRETGRERS